MKINQMIVFDFQGLYGKNEYDFTKEKVTIKIGKNGTGKTSFLNAIRFCLTGQEPKGEMISRGKDACAVTMVMESGTSFSRQKSSRGQKCLINGKPVNVTDFNTQISRYVSAGAMKVLTSSEELGNLKPDALEKLLLTYSPDPTKEEIYGAITELTDEKKKYLDAAFKNEKVSLQELSEAYNDFYEKRRLLRKSLTDKNAEMEVLKRNGLVPPTKTEDELKAAYAAVLEKQKQASAYEAEQRAYQKTLAQVKAREDSINKLKAEIESIKMPEGYAPENRAIAERELATAQERRTEAVASISTYKSTIRTLEKAIATLNQPVCPLSDKLKCTTDKTAIRSELEKTKAENESALLLAQKIIEKAENRAARCQNFLNTLNAGVALEARKQALMKQLADLEANKIELPAEPQKMDFSTVNAEIEAIRAEMDNYKRFMRHVEVKRLFLQEKADYICLDALVNSFSAKGEVREKVMANNVTRFENECNAIASKLGDGNMRIKLMQNNGVVVLADVHGTNNYLEFNSLSGGEKAKVIYVMMALLTKESGFGIMMLDELSVLDNEGLDTLIGTIIDHKDEYDHVFLCMVDHEDSKDILKKYALM